VEDESPAQKAGLKRKDVIIKVDDQKIKNLSDWEDLSYLARADQNLDIGFLRDGKETHVQLSPETLPAEAGKTSQNKLGMTVTDISSPIARQLGISDRRGVVITGIENGSVAQRAGLGVGDIIRQMGDQPTPNMEEFEKMISQLRKSDRVILLIERQGALYFVSLEM
jgi:serine protease Do